MNPAAGRFCPNCGAEVAEAKFCPECGTDLQAVRRALEQGGRGEPAAPSPRSERPAGEPTLANPPPGRGLSPWIIYGGAALAVAIIAVVVIIGLDRDSGTTTAAPTAVTTPGSGSASPVAADTSGTYKQLVTRANGLYDQGATAFTDGQVSQAAAFFSAAAEVYAAAWKKQPGDPSVGTDWATSQFYAGDIAEALGIVDMVLAQSPRYQPALFNKGNFLAHQALLAKQDGNTSNVAKLNAQAKAAYRQAVSIDPKSDVGKQAAAAAAAL